MILANPGRMPRIAVAADSAPDERAEQAVWIDLVDATEAERTLVERITGLRIPDRAALSEIERSSRVSAHAGMLTLSTPMVSRTASHEFSVAPLGFVVSHDRLVTIRFAPMKALDAYAERIADPGEAPPSGIDAFVGVMEAIVDRVADVLEAVGADLDGLSRDVFRPETLRVHRLRRQTVEMLRVLTTVGRAGELNSGIRDSLLGLTRIAVFSAEAAADWTPPALLARLATIRQDLASLSEYDAQLSEKVQFLLDATLGFVNIQQNNVIKVLTVVSIVGIPPTLVASIYGMNFKGMPELSWSFGYPYGLGVIFLSAVLPLLWLWLRGWL